MDKTILIEVFVQPNLCSCSYEPLRKCLDEIKEYLKKKYNIDVEWYILPVNSSRAYELGVITANTIVLNDKIILEGFRTYDQVFDKILQEVSNILNGK